MRRFRKSPQFLRFLWAFPPALFLLHLTPVYAQTDLPDTATTFRVVTNVVLVPTLVTKKSGEIVHGLKPDDFIIRVDGVEQPFQLDESPEDEKLSVIAAIQVGGSAHLLFDEKKKHPWEKGSALSGLRTMLENFIGEKDHETAVVTFDDSVELRQGFTRNLPEALEKIDQLKGSTNPNGSRNPNAAILDAIDYSLQLFSHRPPERRRILILISETRDHYSKTTDLKKLVEKIFQANVQINSIAFKPSRLELTDDLKNKKTPKKPMIVTLSGEEIYDYMPARDLALNALAQNSARPLADITGGEYHQFSGKGSFDDIFNRMANNFRNTYLLSFQADDRPGAHEIEIRLRDAPKGVVIRARKNYWIEQRQPN